VRVHVRVRVRVWAYVPAACVRACVVCDCVKYIYIFGQKFVHPLFSTTGS
jgi:hypothetical protein